MRLRTLGLIAAVAGLTIHLGTGSAGAQMKIGYIDPEMILANYKPYQDAARELNTYLQELQREAAKLNNDIEGMKATYRTRELLYTEQRRKEEQEAIQKKEIELRTMQEQNLSKAQDKDRQLTGAIHMRVNAVVQQVAAEGDYDYILQQPALAFAKEDYDITEQVLLALEKEQEEEAKKNAEATR